MSSNAVETKLRAARIKLLITQPFFGVLSVKLAIIENNTWCKTMATDGKSLYYNHDFIANISLEETQFAVCHELFHCMFTHFLRQQARDKNRWNEATDYAINWILHRDQIGQVIKPNPKLGITKILLDEKYANLTAEEIYEKLQKSGSTPQVPFDCHIYSSPGESSLPDSHNDDGPPRISDKEAAEIAQDFRDSVIDAVEKNLTSSNKVGTIPSEIVRLVKQLTQPKINWRELLLNTIQSHVKSDVSFMRPSRKSEEFILPGRTPEETIRIGCAIDVSGSISTEQMAEFVSEIHGIMSQYPSFEIYIWSFDTECNALERFTEDNAEDLLFWEPIGGGGTCIAENWDFIKRNNIDIDTMIVFTDLCDSSQNNVNPNQVDTVWVIKNEWKEDIEPPFGVWAFLD